MAAASQMMSVAIVLAGVGFAAAMKLDPPATSSTTVGLQASPSLEGRVTEAATSAPAHAMPLHAQAKSGAVPPPRRRPHDDVVPSKYPTAPRITQELARLRALHEAAAEAGEGRRVFSAARPAFEVLGPLGQTSERQRQASQVREQDEPAPSAAGKAAPSAPLPKLKLDTPDESASITDPSAPIPGPIAQDGDANVAPRPAARLAGTQIDDTLAVTRGAVTNSASATVSEIPGDDASDGAATPPRTSSLPAARTGRSSRPSARAKKRTRPAQQRGQRRDRHHHGRLIVPQPR
jgi:hypothetical protein